MKGIVPDGTCDDTPRLRLWLPAENHRGSGLAQTESRTLHIERTTGL